MKTLVAIYWQKTQFRQELGAFTVPTGVPCYPCGYDWETATVIFSFVLLIMIEQIAKFIQAEEEQPLAELPFIVFHVPDKSMVFY